MSTYEVRSSWDVRRIRYMLQNPLNICQQVIHNLPP
jgi:hypothetical protein